MIWIAGIVIVALCVLFMLCDAIEPCVPFWQQPGSIPDYEQDKQVSP